jgi:TRAP-type mannitol/chloroaromatic compound transport system permease small subunit
VATLELPKTPVSRAIDAVLVVVGRASVWIWVVLMTVVVINVAMRHLFGQGRVELEELQWHMNSMGFLLAISYAYQADAHIRIDLVSQRLSERMRAWIELYGTFILLLPFVIMILWFSVPFVSQSFAVGEVSQSPGGLPLRWLIKAMLPLGMALLLLGIISRILRVWAFLCTPKAALKAQRKDGDAEEESA